jgi:hypothetical protein
MDEKKKPEPSRRIDRLPPPVPEIAGSWARCAEPTRALLDFPPYYPSDLIPLTTMIIGQATRKFPVQAQTFDLCKFVVSELTPHFCAAVRSGTLRSGGVALARMGELLHYLVVANCPRDSERYRLKQETVNSDEWLALANGLGHATDSVSTGHLELLSPAVEELRAPSTTPGPTVSDDEQAEEAVWKKIKHDLVKEMSERAEREMDEYYGGLIAQIPSTPTDNLYLQVARLCVRRTEESVTRLSAIYREVWDLQNESRTAAFVSVVFARELLPTLENGITNVKNALAQGVARHEAIRNYNGADQIAVWGEDIIEAALELKKKWQNERNIEVGKLRLKEAHANATKIETGPGGVQPLAVSPPPATLEQRWQNEIEIEATKLQWRERRHSGVDHPSAEQGAGSEVMAIGSEHDFHAPQQRLENHESPQPQTRTATAGGASDYVFQKGERCERLVNEVKLIKHAYVDQARKMTEIQEERPNLLVWEIRESLDAEDRQLFNHPNQWGPVIGYAERLLEKSERQSRSTIQRWRKQYKRTLKSRKK